MAGLDTQATERQGNRAPDIAIKIAAAMRQMGVKGLPCNYELFYEAYTGTNQELIAALVDLEPGARQEELDRIATSHLSHTRAQDIVEDARATIEEKIEEIMILLLKEKASLETYGRLLDETTNGIGRRAVVTRELLERVVDVMATATHTTIDHGRQIASSMADKTAELDSVKAKLEEYKRLADTDPLTNIYNRRAFDRALGSIYDEPRQTMYSTLVIADIDDFKRINDRFGHPTGDRIIRGVANIFKSLMPEDIFVARTGGEEFAFIIESGTLDAVTELAETLRLAVEKATFVDDFSRESCGQISISLGICTAAEAKDPDDLYGKADRAMYASKVDGRNRLTHYSSLVSTGARKDWLIYKTD